MFTIEHDYDATVITLVDDNAGALSEDVTIRVFDDIVTIEQYDAKADEPRVVHLSPGQVEDLRAALNLPEGTYRRRPE